MALVTIWFVNAAHPRDVLLAEPQADRGFARKYLAQLNGAWPRTHIGDFDMVRSSSPGMNEFYIGGYPAGLSVVQVVIPGLVRLSELPQRFRQLVSSADVYATAVLLEEEHAALQSGVAPVGLKLPGGVVAGQEPEADQLNRTFGAFAHWSGGTLKRVFSATRQKVFEDEGLPEVFESRYWEGTHETTGILLPFDPSQMALGAARAWLGFPVTTQPDAWGHRHEALPIPVAAFAIDGRPEASLGGSAAGGSLAGGDQYSTTAEQDGWDAEHDRQILDAHDRRGAVEHGYDDYAAPAGEREPTGVEVAKKIATSSAQLLRRGVKAGASLLTRGAGRLRRNNQSRDIKRDTK